MQRILGGAIFLSVMCAPAFEATKSRMNRFAQDVSAFGQPTVTGMIESGDRGFRFPDGTVLPAGRQEGSEYSNLAAEPLEPDIPTTTFTRTWANMLCPCPRSNSWHGSTLERMHGADASIYDTVPYHGMAHPNSHPDCLATLALLNGMDPAPVEDCRVLDLGCGNGSNLLPMAFGLPESTFVGIDLAVRPIELAKDRAQALGLENVSLHQADLMDFPTDWGTFDYIIAHGFYSWVHDEVKDRLLEVSRAHLAPHGVVFISYNIYPGWHSIQATREMMLFHVRDIDDPLKRARQGRALLQFLLDGQPEMSPFRPFLEREVQRIAGMPNWLLLHDLIAEVNTPCYFHEFARHAAEHGLQYLGEAEFAVMHARAFPPKVRETLDKLQLSEVLREQYLDFLRGRPFRQTLLCHQEVHIDRTLTDERLRTLYAAAPIRDVSDGTSSNTTFEGIKNHTIETDHAFTQAVCRYLGDAWPRYVSFNELLTSARSLSGSKTRSRKDAGLLGEMLINFYAEDFIELHAHMPRLASEVSECPEASPVARHFMEASPIVPTLLHTTVQLDEQERLLLPLLNGTRSLDDLLKTLNDGDQASIEKHHLEQILDGLMRHGLLLA